MSYFTPDFLKFFIDLAANNNRDWFHANKKRHEESVKEPFKAFIGDLIAAVHKDDDSFNMPVKKAIFRIHRDVRFSKDKTPYKLNTSAIITPGDRRNMDIPGMYIEMSPERLAIYGGSYMPKKEHLYAIRQTIAQDMGAFEKELNNTAFKDTFGSIHGDQNKRLPKEFQEAHKQQNLIANKQFYFFAEHDPEMCFRDDLLDFVMEHYFAGKSMSHYLRRAIASAPQQED